MSAGLSCCQESFQTKILVTEWDLLVRCIDVQNLDFRQLCQDILVQSVLLTNFSLAFRCCRL
jgi:hypothetical protein